MSACHGLARVLSKRGYCSRSQAEALIRAGRVYLDGRLVRDPEWPTDVALAQISVDGARISARERLCILLNKPRGLLTTARDDCGRDTVYRCLQDAPELGWLAPVGRLDKASEGLLLLTNDPEWAARVSDPRSGPDKTYHVQINGQPTAEQLVLMQQGVRVDGELWRVKSARLLRAGQKNAWLEVVLDEGKNRQIRRILAASGHDVLRLIRVAIGSLVLGDLPKGHWRQLSAAEVAALVQ